MIVVTAVMKTADGKRGEVEQIFKKTIPKFLADPGTIDYGIHRAINDPNKLLVLEKYEDMEALNMHSSAEHFKEMGRALGSLLAGRPEIELYNPVE
jgi:quinol monooxygenase YgiN